MDEESDHRPLRGVYCTRPPTARRAALNLSAWTYSTCLCRFASFFPFFASRFSFRFFVGSFFVLFLLSRALLMMMLSYRQNTFG
jgi:hypothetical protein